MKQLNAQSTQVFVVLIDHLNDGYLKIINEPFMPLSVERIGESVLPKHGKATLYSLCHYYKQNGDLMQDPEMCFAVVDNRAGSELSGDVVVIPYMFQQANLGIYQESIQNQYGLFTDVDIPSQTEHVLFANHWLENIKEQGFLDGFDQPKRCD